MNDVYVLNNSTFAIEGIIDTFESCIWRPAYSDIGDFELYLPANKKAVELLELDRYLVRSCDVEVDSDNITTYKKVMIIKNVDLKTDAENGDYLTVTGRELKYLTHQRIIWSQTNLTGTAENAMRTLVTQNAISPSDNKRAIPHFVLGASAGFTDTIDKQVTGDKLSVALVDIATAYGYGWDMYIYDSNIVFIVYKGEDRSYNQSALPYVVFSDSFDNLLNTEYSLSTEEYGNTTLIGGEGEGTERIYRTVGAANAGLNRFEVFTDARDLSRNSGTAQEIPLADYYALLEGRGSENLAALAYVEGFSGEALSTGAFEYGTDFDLGDIVTVINSYGIRKNVKVLSAVESEDANGTKLLPVFSTMSDVLTNMTHNMLKKYTHDFIHAYTHAQIRGV